MNITLVRYEVANRTTFVQWCAAIDAFSFLSKSAPSAPDAAALFERLQHISFGEVAGQHAWAVTGRVTGELLGHLELKVTEKTLPGEGELVVFVAPAHRGSGVATAAVKQLLASTDIASQVIRAVAYCRPANIFSLRLLKRAGFVSLQERASAEHLCFGRELVSRS